MLFIDNCALCLIRICFTIAKPRPVPPIFLDLALSTRKNLSVSLSIYLSGIHPQPQERKESWLEEILHIQ